MHGTSIFFDAMLYLYALSLLFMFSDFVERNLRAKQLGAGLLAFVWALQTIYLFYEASQMRMETMLQLFGSLFFLSWLVITLSLALNFIMRIDVLFLVNLAGFAIASLGFFGNRDISGAVLQWQVRDDLLVVHISLAAASYSLFILSALLSAMLLFLYGRLKSKRWSAYMSRMPSLEVTHKITMWLVVAGVPLLIASLVLGLSWITYGQQWRLLGDWKVIHTVLILLIYGYYIWMRLRGKRSWTQLAVINLIGLAAVLGNLIWSNTFSEFH